MGVVYLPEELARHELPRPGAHQLAAAYFLRACEQSEFMEAAQIYGSTLHTPRLRSDLDIVSMYPLEAAKDASDERQAIIANIWNEYHVKTECHSVPVLGEMQFPERDMFFARYLLEVAKEYPAYGVGNPEVYIERLQLAASPVEERLRAFDYVGAKSTSFNHALDTLLPDYGVMQRALELVSALGRKLIPFLHAAAEQLSDLEYAVDSRERMTASITRGLGALSLLGWNVEHILQHQNELLVLDGAYTSVLEDTAGGRMPVGDYEQWLSQHYRPALQAALGLSNGWLELMARISANSLL